ncbi:Jag N-terminal domain-containing protein, partial [Campylobacter coli]
MRIEAKDLQSALTEASKSLECSVIDLEYEIIQYSKNGFLGFWRKNAIIEAR